MADLLKLKEGLQACIRLQKGEPVSCEVCPYNNGRMTCETMRAILEDAEKEIGEYIRLKSHIAALTTCNDCGKLEVCCYEPPWGAPVRYNCPHWEERP